MAERTNDQNWEQLLEAVFQEHYKFLYQEACKVVQNEQDAEDIVQDLYLKMAESGFKAQIRTNPKAYLRQAVVHDAWDLVRSRKRRRKDEPVEDLEIAAPGTERADDNIRNQLDSAFASMSNEVKEIVMLHCQDGYSDSEIAEARGEKRSKIASILSRSRAKLKEAGGPDSK